MEKTLKALSFTKRILAILTVAVLAVGALFYIASSYIGISTNTALKILGGFAIGIMVFMLVNIAYLIVEWIDKKRNKTEDNPEKTEQEQTPILNSKFLNSCYEFLKKHQQLIGIVLSVVVVAVSCIFLAIYPTKWITRSYVVYADLNYIFWALIVYGFYALLLSKDKKSFIVGSVVFAIELVLVSLMSAKASVMHPLLGSRAYTNFLEYNILLVIYAILNIFSLNLISTHGDFKKIGFSTNFGFGFITFACGMVMLYSEDITKLILKATGAEDNKNGSLSFLAEANHIIYIILGICLLLVVVNFVLNAKKFVKTKNVIGIIDLALGVVGIVLFIIGFQAMTRFLIFWPIYYTL